jgi:D-xylose transport system permease protein
VDALNSGVGASIEAAAASGGAKTIDYDRLVLHGKLGAAVIATIANGSDLVGFSAATRFIVTGIILLAAVTLDTVSRRRLAGSGR